MRYLYINQSEDKIVLISKKSNEGKMLEGIVEYIISDDFDLTKDMGDGEMLEGFLTATEFLERYNADYISKRINEYPLIEDQLDKIFHSGIDAWKSDIQAIKDKYPKG